MLKISRTLNDHIREENFTKYMFIDPEKIHKLSGDYLKRIINHLLPPTRKFLRESFNAIENGEILGQISVIPDNFSNFRWQISSLKLKENNKFIAKTLIDYVINKYGGNGVSSFLVYIDDVFSDIISLFKNECGFRSCAKIDFFVIKNLTEQAISFQEENFKELEKSDIISLLEINTSNIFSNFRPSLISELKDFEQDFFEKTRNNYLKVFIVNGKQEGYFRIYSDDKKNFFADVITTKPYEHCYKEIVSYIQKTLLLAPEFESLTIMVKRYRETSGALESALSELNYKHNTTTHILVKDYWQQIKDDASADKLFVFFNDLSIKPARYNSFKF